jgi:hypothetical protein
MRFYLLQGHVAALSCYHCICLHLLMRQLTRKLAMSSVSQVNTSTLPRSAAHTSRDERQNLLDALGAPDPHLKIARDTAVKKPTGWSCDCEYWQ